MLPDHFGSVRRRILATAIARRRRKGLRREFGHEHRIPDVEILAGIGAAAAEDGIGRQCPRVGPGQPGVHRLRHPLQYQSARTHIAGAAGARE